jgi:hypothetical protein
MSVMVTTTRQEPGTELFAKVWGADARAQALAHVARTARLRARLIAAGTFAAYAGAGAPRARRRSALDANRDALRHLRHGGGFGADSSKGSDKDNDRGKDRYKDKAEEARELAARALRALTAEDEEQDAARSDVDWELRDLQRAAGEELAAVVGWCGARWGWGTWS